MKAQLSVIYVDGKVWCKDLYPSDFEKYLNLAKKENPKSKITTTNTYKSVWSEDDIMNMSDEEIQHRKEQNEI